MRKRGYLLKVVPCDRSGCGERRMAVPAGGVKPTRDPRPQYAPMERARTELIAPHTYSPRERVRCIEAPVRLTEHQMVRR